jgi:spermidine synthase
MAGLAVGSYAIGRIADRQKNLLRLYGILELVIAVSALATPLLFRGATDIFSRLVRVFPDPAFILSVKFALTCMVLIIPTAAMGGTLPTLIRFFRVTFGGTVSRETGWLYAVNTFGAMTGVLATGFVLIELLGLRGTLYSAVIINILLALCAAVLSKREYGRPEQPEAPLGQSTDRQGYPKSRVILVISFFGISGLLSLAYEIAWTRLLTPTLGTYIYAFSLILGLILLGIALGSLLYERLLSKCSATLLLLGIAEVIIGAAALFSLVVTSSAFSMSNMMLVACVLLPATIAMGMTFPIISNLPHDPRRTGRFIGSAYAVNTIGALLGPLVADFILLRIWGTTNTVLLLVLANSVLGIALILLETRRGSRGIKGVCAGVGVCTILLAVILRATDSDLLMEKSLRKYMERFRKSGTYAFMYVEDEAANTLAFKSADGKDVGLLVDGQGMSDMGNETKLMAHLPLLIHPDPKTMLVICFGMGTTFRSALSYDIRVDAVELIPSVPKTFPVFFKDAPEVMKNPNGRIIVNDGRNYVRLTDKKYDVIQVDPPPPVNSAGTTVLYSKEFYEDGMKILADDGLFIQWLFFGTRNDDFQMLVRSFIDVFPYVSVYDSPRQMGLYLIGSKRPIPAMDTGQIAGRLQNRKAFEDLNEWGEWNATNLSALFMGDKTLLEKYARGAKPVTDNNPRTEYFLLRRKTSAIPGARDSWIVQ